MDQGNMTFGVLDIHVSMFANAGVDDHDFNLFQIK